ncbi:MAG: DUF2225 domain-containing protein [Lachnospiraceae bacterium]|nr:DUF2225 domain-containing protein [Lachnospiraceae bacterium]
MGLLSGLEKFGLSVMEELDITDDGKKKEVEARAKESAEKKYSEEDFVFEKQLTCPVCNRKFPNLVVLSTKLKRLEPDSDLRPNHEAIDTLKYEITSCPSCGYSAMNKFFDHLSQAQIKWIREAVGEKFESVSADSKPSYTYDEACDRYKLALVCAMAKRARLSEKSLICLRLAWLRRGQIKQMPHTTPEELEAVKELKTEMDGFYKQAYEGFQKAISVESPPFCGMNTNTLEYLLANMALYFKDFAKAGRFVGKLQTDPNTPQRVKDKCYVLKEEILAEMKKANENKDE